MDLATSDQKAKIISIHAPARGATPWAAIVSPSPLKISIHAPARGATTAVRLLSGLTKISIHAPARGAT